MLEFDFLGEVARTLALSSFSARHHMYAVLRSLRIPALARPRKDTHTHDACLSSTRTRLILRAVMGVADVNSDQRVGYGEFLISSYVLMAQAVRREHLDALCAYVEREGSDGSAQTVLGRLAKLAAPDMSEEEQKGTYVCARCHAFGLAFSRRARGFRSRAWSCLIDRDSSQ